MAAPAAADSSGPRFAPDDPTLPAPWKGLVDGTTLYYWNPETNVTQYEKPAAAAPPPLPTGPPAATPPAQQVQEPAPGAFLQPSVQFGQAGQASHQERPGQSAYPQAAQTGQQPQQPAQQPPFQHIPQHQASFPQAQQQMPYHHQQQQQQQPQMQQQQPPQYPNTHPQQHTPYQHGPYMQSQQQQQQQPGSQYTYQAGQQPQMPQTAYNQVQQPPIPQPAYNQGQKPAIPQSAFSQGQQPQMPHGAYHQGQQPPGPGVRVPQSQVQQHPQQSPTFHQPVQASQSPHVSQSQGHQMTPQQPQTPHGLHFNPQHGQQPYHGHIGAQLSQVSHVQPGPLLKDDDIGGHEGKQAGFSLPPGQQRGQAPLLNQQLSSGHQHPGVRTQLNTSGAGGPMYPGKHLGGSSPARCGGWAPKFVGHKAWLTNSGVVHRIFR